MRGDRENVGNLYNIQFSCKPTTAFKKLFFLKKKPSMEFPLWPSGNPASIHEYAGSLLSLAQWVQGPIWLWHWCRLPNATSPN